MTINFGLLNPDTPANAANSLYQGQQQQVQNQLAQAQLQQAQGANALQQYQLTSAQRNDQLQNKMLADLNAANGDPEQIKNALIRAGKPQDAFKLQTEQANLGKTQAETQKMHLEFMNQSARDMASNPSDDNIKSWVSKAVGMGNLNMQDATNVLSSALAKSPTERSQMFAGMGAKAEDLLKRFTPDYSPVNLGGRTAMIDKNSVTNPNIAQADLTHTVSPDSQLHNSVLMRGQNMVDSRQRETNGIMADGQNSPFIETNAQAIASGQLPPITGIGLRSPTGARTMARVMELNPDYNAQNYSTSQKADKDFATGKQGQAVKSFNVALDHLDTLDQLAGALNNKDTQLLNKVGNYFSTQTGQPAPTNFEAAKKIVADEVVKAIVGSGGGVSDREDAAKTISSASSPAQLQGVIQTYKSLMKGQLNGLSDQYKATTGRNDFEDRYLSKNAKSVAHGAPAGASALPSGWSVEAH